MKNLFVLIFLSISFTSFSQENYSISNLTSELLVNANSVIVNNSVKIVIDDYNSMTIIEEKTISILNKEGLSDLDAFEFYDKSSTKIRNLRATVFNVLGQKINTFKEKDFTDVSAVGSVSLYSDNRIKYLDYIPASYPVTIKIEKEIKTKNTAFIRAFRPYKNYYQSIKSSSYEIINTSGVELRQFENAYMDNISNLSESKEVIKYSVKNLPAIPREVYSPPLENFTPKVMFSLQTFELEGEKGKFNTWKEFGKWQYDNLLKGLGNLPETTVAKVKSITKNLTSDKEKAEAVYNYVQDNMRYISVQIGIGGWKPISAEEVDEKKYGDCKGLTNYTKALMNAVGIEANYCVVQAGSEIIDISEDFPSMQGNHVILNLPQEGEPDIWLECTSQDIPFNFLGTFTDDRNVLAVKPSGGVIMRTPSYSEEDNHQLTKANILIDKKTIKAKVEITTKGTQYNTHYQLIKENEKAINEHYLSYWDNLKELNILSYEFQNNRDDVIFKEKIDLEAKNYIKIYGNDLILDVNPFNKFQVNLPRYSNKKTPFRVSRGFVDQDEFIFKLDQIILDSELEDIELVSKFGIYRLTFEKVNDNLVVKRYLKLKKNNYKKSDYSGFVDFFSKISRFDSTKISLKIT